MPQLWELLKQNRENPPINFMVAEFLRGTAKQKGLKRDAAVGEALKNIPTEHLVTEAKKAVRSRTGSKIIGIVQKKTGRKVI